MRISEKTRPARAGVQLGKSIIEMIHLFYLNDNALEFLKGVAETLRKELGRRVKELVAKEKEGG